MEGNGVFLRISFSECKVAKEFIIMDNFNL